MWAGLIPGFIFGFLLKRSRICLAGGLRDVYMEKRNTGLIVMLLIISAQSVIYFSLVDGGLIPAPKYGNFSVVGTIVGGLMFGFGALISNGCITTTMIKTGDGRMVGVLSLLSFVFFGSAAKKGFLVPIAKALQSVAVIPGDISAKLPVSPLTIAGVLLVVVLLWAWADKKKDVPLFELPAQHTGLRHLFFEKIWDPRVTAVLIGIAAGLSYWLSRVIIGSASGWGMTTPLVTWFQFLGFGDGKLNWGCFFVLGIALGSFVCAKGSGEYALTGTDGPSMLKALIGGGLMSFGAVVGGGCIVGHGLAGTARLSAQSWLGFISIILGIRLGVRIFYSDAVAAKK